MFCGECGEPNPDGKRFCAACGHRLTSTSGSQASGLNDVPTITSLPPGTLLANRYCIERLLGQGGMGQVYLARDQTLDIPVAVKTMSALLQHDAGAVERLKDEARAALQLAHPNIVRVNHFEDGESLKFLVMEYVEGETLARRVVRDKRLDEAEVRRIGIALCEALAHAHASSVLHRDVKPANVLLGARGAVKLADFGIARVARDSVSRLTGTVTAGTLMYMAPELVMGEKATPQGDLYGLGAVLYELLSGEPPFHTGDVSRQILEKAPDALPGVSRDLEATVLRLLAKRPEERFESAAAVRKELDGTAAAARAAEQARQEEEARRLEKAREAEKSSGARQNDDSGGETDGAALPGTLARPPSQSRQLTVIAAVSMSAAAVLILLLSGVFTHRVDPGGSAPAAPSEAASPAPSPGPPQPQQPQSAAAATVPATSPGAEPAVQAAPIAEQDEAGRSGVGNQAATPAMAPIRIGVGSGARLARPTKTKDAKPIYPDLAAAAHVEGVVIIEATIGPDGKVQDANILHSIPLLDQAALDAVRQWEFTPTTLDGVPVPVIMTVTVNFALK